MNDLKDALLTQMRTAGSVTWARAPDGQKGTYAVARLDMHPREDDVTQLIDIRLDIYSQESDYEAVELAEAISSAMHGWSPPGSSGRLKVGDIQHVPADQSDPHSTRLTMDITGVWASQTRVSALTSLGGVS